MYQTTGNIPAYAQPQEIPRTTHVMVLQRLPHALERPYKALTALRGGRRQRRRRACRARVDVAGGGLDLLKLHERRAPVHHFGQHRRRRHGEEGGGLSPPGVEGSDHRVHRLLADARRRLLHRQNVLPNPKPVLRSAVRRLVSQNAKVGQYEYVVSRVYLRGCRGVPALRRRRATLRLTLASPSTAARRPSSACRRGPCRSLGTASGTPCPPGSPAGPPPEAPADPSGNGKVTGSVVYTVVYIPRNRKMK
eukprot:7371725-Pyramimonas_sp.AAC.1